MKYEFWRCPFCGEPLGYFGRIMFYIFGTSTHRCRDFFKLYEGIKLKNIEEDNNVTT